MPRVILCPMPLHEHVDLSRWIQEFGFGPLAEEVRRWAVANARPVSDPEPASIERDLPMTGVHGPKDLSAIEQIRAGLGVGTLGPASPTDVFLWALGEPANRAATKMGGLAYRPASQPWPRGAKGQAMHLLAQVCFADSRDVVSVPGGLMRKARALPGDVLLIFAPGEYLEDWDDDDQASLVFEWQPLGLTGLAGLDAGPRSPLTPVHGHIHRTADYHRPPDGHAIYNLYSAKDVALMGGTKIGGVPACGGELELPGTHLCTIASLNPTAERFPLINVADGHELRDGSNNTFLMMADVWSLYLFIDKSAKIHWTVKGG